MATWSRDEGETAAKAKPVAAQLDPNTQSRTGTSTSTSTQTQSSSSFQGLTGSNKSAQEMLVNQLMYGTTSPETEEVYVDRQGKEHSLTSYIQQYGDEAGKAMWHRFTTVTVPQDAAGNPWNPGFKLENKITSPTIVGKDPAKQSAVAELQKLLSSYSPDQAQGDANLAMQGVLRQAMEQNMPAINRAIENAGTSGGSQEALLSQDLATRSAQAAAQLGLDAKASYGGISANLSQTLAGLVNSQDPTVAALMQALDLGRINSSSSSGSSTQSSSQTDTSAPIGISNPDLFLPISTSAKVSHAKVSPAEKYSVAPSYSSANQGAVAQPSGDNFIYNNATGNMTTFGDTTEAAAKRRLLGQVA